MPQRGEAWLRHQQARWLQPDAHRWLRPDAARFLKPGSDLAEIYPALELKYNANQPRVPAGNPDGGQWTISGGSARLAYDAAPADLAQPMGNVAIRDAARESADLFAITPRRPDRPGVRLAGELPEGGNSNATTPSVEPPQIPSRMPDSRDERMAFVRNAARWIAAVGRFAPIVDVYFGALEQVQEINRLTAMIRTANDPARSLEELQRQVGMDSEPGYHDHHVVNQHVGNRAKFGELIDSKDNVVRIPELKHIEISRYYSTTIEWEDGTLMSPRDRLRTSDFETQRQFGYDVLRKFGVLR